MPYNPNNQPTILTIRRIIDGTQVKNFKPTLLSVNFSEAIEFKQILHAYCLPKEIITVLQKFERKGPLKEIPTF